MVVSSSSGFVEVLRRVPLFAELSASELSSLSERVSLLRMAAGEVVFLEGARCGGLLIVMEGAVRVVKTAASGRHQLLAIERPGSSLGEVSVFDGGPYSATAIAETDVALLRVDAREFRSLCAAHPEIAMKVIRVLGHRLRRLRVLVEELSFGTVRHRLIAHLLRLAEEQGRAEVVLEENNEELAGRLGTVREIVSRNLGRLHGDGLIVMRKRSVRIPDVAALRAELREA
jgi:CRP/FNR family transcriptional regulator, cyclic AMP receptor protein